MTSPSLVSTNGFSTSDIDVALSFPGDASSTKRASALSNKLTSVLSSSYADSETRDALRLLDARSAQNAEETRLNLKSDAQQQVIDANAQIVDDFGKVADQLKRVGALITILNQTCDDMRDHIQLAKQETAPMLEEASILLARKQETESKQQLLTAFTGHFLISDEDLTTLTSSAEPVNDEYFAVLARVKQIHKDCEILLGYENQRLGLELMEQTTRNLDAGYQKLYNWIQREFKGLDLEDPHISGSIRRSLRALSERPTLFQNCLDFFGEARQATLGEAFGRALTDSTLRSSKAIEFSTHDPLRYIGDMLAWVHSTTVSEKEALEGLFISDADEISRGLKSGKSTEPWARVRRTSTLADGAVFSSEDEDDDDDSADPVFDGHAALSSLISRNMSSVAQILNQRVSLTVRNLTDQITLYKSYNLLLFYQEIFIKLLGVSNLSTQTPLQARSKQDLHAQNSLLVTLSTLQSQASIHFETTVKEDIEAHSSLIDPAPTTFQPPGILQSNLVLFSSILHLRAPNLTTTEFARLYSTLIAPLISLCGEAATSLSSKAALNTRSNNNSENKNDEDHEEEDDDEPEETLDSTVYRLNYLHPVLSTLKILSKDKLLSDFTDAPIRSAETERSKLSNKLADFVTERFSVASGVHALIDILQTYKTTATTKTSEKTKSEQKEDWTDLVAQAEDSSATLDSFLASALMDVQDDLGKVSDKALVKGVVEEAVGRFCVEVERVVALLEALDEEVEDVRDHGSEMDIGAGDGVDGEQFALLREVYPRTVGEVRALLS